MIASDELERTWKVITQHLPGETRKTSEKPVFQPIFTTNNC
jgi:hypothetical protein